MKGVELTYDELCDLLVLSPYNTVKKGFYVSQKVFRRFHLERQNTVIRNGRVVEPTWVRLSGGLYKVFLEF